MGGVLALAGLATGAYLLVVPAATFGLVAYFMWYHASGRLAARIYASVEAQATQEPDRGPSAQRSPGFGAGPRQAWERPRGSSRRGNGYHRRTTESTATGRSPDRPAAVQAADVLGVDPDADESAIRSAYRERIKQVHPDTDGGDEAQFKRVREAYEILAE